MLRNCFLIFFFAMGADCLKIPQEDLEPALDLSIGIAKFESEEEASVSSFTLKGTSAGMEVSHVPDYEPDMSLFKNIKPKNSWDGVTNDAIKPVPGHYKGLGNFLKHLVTGLNSTMIEKLQSCKAKGTGVWKSKVKGPDVWIVLNAEDDDAGALAKKSPDKSLILGPGIAGNQLESQSINGKKSRNIFMPFASLFFAESHAHSPLELVDRTVAKKSLKKKTDDLVVLYQQHTCYPYREKFFDVVCEGLKKKGKACHYNSKCKGHNSNAQHWVGNKGNPYDDSVANYEAFKFVIAVDHRPNNYGYLTEKIVTPFLAGSVPVYAGAQNVGDVFDPRSFIQAETTDGGASTMAQMDKLMNNRELYEEMVSRPAVTEANFRKFFTWHSDTWKKYGDDARQRILSELLAMC